MGLLKEDFPWLSVEIDGLGTARDLAFLVELVVVVVAVVFDAVMMNIIINDFYKKVITIEVDEIDINLVVGIVADQ